MRLLEEAPEKKGGENARFWTQVSLDKELRLATDRKQTATKYCNTSPYWSFCNDMLSR